MKALEGHGVAVEVWLEIRCHYDYSIFVALWWLHMGVL
jgi:hypothetical protein